MDETWAIDEDDGASVSPDTVQQVLRERIDGGRRETWLISSSGRSLTFVTNGERAMVALLNGTDAPGERAVDPGARGSSTGFVLSNGQHDEYPNEDTVPLEEALRIFRHIVSEGSRPPDAPWAVDR
ncbi:hypothetical protein [Streptomyces sp. NPDC058872]|uniref:hypothetical protein n=1 Tax=Streptomyces sp. NPDC058872 TaxID=3346661 RepID=UPI0036CC7940